MALRRHHHVRWNRRPNAKGNQGHRPARAQILGLDWWFDLGLSIHLPTDVDFETGIRRSRTFNRPQKVLLISHLFTLCILFFWSTNKHPPQKKKKKKKKKS